MRYRPILELQDLTQHLLVEKTLWLFRTPGGSLGIYRPTVVACVYTGVACGSGLKSG